MLRMIVLTVVLTFAHTGLAFAQGSKIEAIVSENVLSGFEKLAVQTQHFADTAQDDCNPRSEDLRSAYRQAFLSWSRVSHLRFGPSEEDNRAFALAFWPDPRGKTPKALRGLILSEDAAALTPEKMQQASVAQRGFYAMDYLLFDPELSEIGSPAYRCDVIRALAKDIAQTADTLSSEWQAFAPTLISPTEDSAYRTEQEVSAVLFKSASTGLQFTSELRFGRPLGSFDRPRPKRAEAWRSGLSQDLALAAIQGTGDLALALSSDQGVSDRLTTSKKAAELRLRQLNDPDFSGVESPGGRIRLEAVQTTLNQLRAIVDGDLARHLGVGAGFNSLDGD